MNRIPFDAFGLSVVREEAAGLLGTELLDVRQTRPWEIVLGFAGGSLLLSADPENPAAYLTSRRPNGPPLSSFGGRCVRALRGRVLERLDQPAGDRTLVLDFGSGWRLYGEFIGPKANLRLVLNGTIEEVARPGGPQSGEPYAPPGGGFAGRASAFLRKLAEARGVSVEALRAERRPTLADVSAYPIDPAPLVLGGHPRPTFSAALEIAVGREAAERRTEKLRQSLLTRLDRVILARETALRSMADAERAGGRAGKAQREAELLQAYGYAGGAVVDGFDHEGAPWSYRLPEGVTAEEEAARLFDKARRAKTGARQVVERQPLVRLQLEEANALRDRVLTARTTKELDGLEGEARRRRWVSESLTTSEDPQRAAFDGHKIRLVEGPFGFPILFGENAEANDHLTLRVCKPTDLWFHVRGATGSHVVIRTDKKPDRVPQETIREAARIAAHHSAAKHSRWIPVDFTERRFVRKPRGAPAGSCEYSRERTVHVEGI